MTRPSTSARMEPDGGLAGRRVRGKPAASDHRRIIRGLTGRAAHQLDFNPENSIQLTECHHADRLPRSCALWQRVTGRASDGAQFAARRLGSTPRSEARRGYAHSHTREPSTLRSRLQLGTSRGWRRVSSRVVPCPLTPRKGERPPA